MCVRVRARSYFFFFSLLPGRLAYRIRTGHLPTQPPHHTTTMSASKPRQAFCKLSGEVIDLPPRIYAYGSRFRVVASVGHFEYEVGVYDDINTACDERDRAYHLLAPWRSRRCSFELTPLDKLGHLPVNQRLLDFIEKTLKPIPPTGATFDAPQRKPRAAAAGPSLEEVNAKLDRILTILTTPKK